MILPRSHEASAPGHGERATPLVLVVLAKADQGRDRRRVSSLRVPAVSRGRSGTGGVRCTPAAEGLCIAGPCGHRRAAGQDEAIRRSELSVAAAR
jgi:hypothetical protein